MPVIETQLFVNIKKGLGLSWSVKLYYSSGNFSASEINTKIPGVNFLLFCHLSSRLDFTKGQLRTIRFYIL